MREYYIVLETRPPLKLQKFSAKAHTTKKLTESVIEEWRARVEGELNLEDSSLVITFIQKLESEVDE